MASERDIARAYSDFKVFLFLLWKHLGLPAPTPAQYEMADWLQNGPRDRGILAFRGVGKSWITSAYVIWRLWNDVELKVLVISASKDRADAFSIFSKRVLSEVAWLKHLAPDPRAGDRDSNFTWDVRGCAAAHAPSVKSVGITGQITGSRAGLIVCDDVEVLNNSETSTQRAKMLPRIAELGGAVITPVTGETVFLGTPQVEDSMYNHLHELEEPANVKFRVWPAQYPKNWKVTCPNLSPTWAARLESGEVQAGDPTDPLRFDDQELALRRIKYGAAGYALQFMLDTTLADEDRNPLKTRDFMVMDVGHKIGPDTITWSGDREYRMEHLPNMGLSNDSWQKPMFVDKQFSPWSGKVMYIDPSGRGKDQTGYCIVFSLHGNLFVKKWGGLKGGYDNETLAELCTMAIDAKVNSVIVEDNFGDGMYTQLLRPILSRLCAERWPQGEHNIGCEEEHVSGQKERRIIDSVEPVLVGHRVVIDTAVVKAALRDKSAIGDPNAGLKTGPYQLTRITFDRGSLKHDDIIEALGGAVRHFTQGMAQNAGLAAKEREIERNEKSLREFVEGIENKEPPAAGWHETVF